MLEGEGREGGRTKGGSGSVRVIRAGLYSLSEFWWEVTVEEEVNFLQSLSMEKDVEKTHADII